MSSIAIPMIQRHPVYQSFINAQNESAAIQAACDQNCLPESINAKIDYKISLIYLTTLNNDKSICSKDQQKVLRKEKLISKCNRLGLRYGWIPIIAASYAISYVAFLPNSSLDAASQQWVSSNTVGTVTAVVALAAFIFTGNLPDAASSKANDRQNIVASLEKHFTELGHTLALSFSKLGDDCELAKQLAQDISIETLKSRATADGFNTAEQDRIFKVFKACHTYVASGGKELPYTETLLADRLEQTPYYKSLTSSSLDQDIGLVSSV